MKAIVFDQIGTPKNDFEVLQLKDVPIPTVGDDEVLVKMVSTTVNPGDFLFIQGLYPEPKKPTFPGQIAGTHGAGIIEKVGKNVSYQVGTFVYFSYLKSWGEYAVVPSEYVIPLPSDYPIEKAAQYGNLVTAWDLLEETKVQKGQWIVVTAGNSTVATMISQFAKQKGIHVISIVRRLQERLCLKALGATEVIELATFTGNITDKIKQITGNQGVHGIIDCVGGPIIGDLIRSLAFGGKIIIYGGYSEDRFEIHNFDILFQYAEMKAYAYRYFFTPPKQEDMQFLNEIAKLSGSLDFYMPIGAFHDIRDFKEAVYQSIHHPEQGKRILSFRGIKNEQNNNRPHP